MVKSSYLLLGPELGDKKDYILSLKKEITRQFGTDFEEYTYYPYDANINEALVVAMSLSMFASFKLIFINDCSQLKKKDLQPFIDYLNNPASDTMLIFTDQGTKVDAKLEKSVGEKKVFWELDESRRKSYAISYFNKNHIYLDADGAGMIAENSESNTLSVRNECDKLLLFFHDRQQLSGEEIRELLSCNKEESVFSLFDHILTSTLDKTLNAANSLMLASEGEPIQLIGGLVWQFKRFLEFKAMLSDNFSSSEAFAKMNIRARKAQDTYLTGSRRYTLKNTEQIIELCNYYDQFFRNVRTDIQKLYFPVFLYEIMIKKGVRTEECIFSNEF